MPTPKNLSNVNVGTGPNAGNGDLVRDAFVKINSNFNEIYTNGQVLAFGTDTKNNPGFSWTGDKDTGFYRPGSGKITVSLNGADSLQMAEDGTFKWFGDTIATQSFVTARLNAFTGGVSAANISVAVSGGTANVTINGIPVVSSLPTLGNYTGRIVFYLGVVWTYSNYPVGNGAGLSANPTIGRAAGSDSRWVRFRGDSAVSFGIVRPETAAEGTIFYETANARSFVYLTGSWRTLASIVGSNVPAGLQVVTSLPLVGDPGNYSGRTVVNTTDDTAYIFVSGAWETLSNYVSGGGAGGVPFGGTLPLAGNIGDIFRKTGTNSGLYIYDSDSWQTLGRYAANAAPAKIPTLASLPTNVSAYDPGSLIIVGTTTYILNTTKTAWNFFTPGGAGGTITGIALNPGQVGNVELAANAVLSTKLASNSVLSFHLTSNVVTTAKIADSAVTAVKIQNNSITSSKIQANSITDREIAANSVSGSRITTGSIDKSKLAANVFTGVTISANNLSEVSTDLGTMTKGVLRTLDNRMIIDLNNRFIRIEL